MPYSRPTNDQYRQLVLDQISELDSDIGGYYQDDVGNFHFPEPDHFDLYITVDQVSGGNVELVYRDKLVYSKSSNHFSGLERRIKKVHRLLRSALYRDGVISSLYGGDTVVSQIYEYNSKIAA